MRFIKKIRNYCRAIVIAHRATESFVNQKQISDLEPLYKQYSAESLGLLNSSTLDIGCGDKPRNPFNAINSYGIDIREDIPKNIKYADLAIEPIPFGDGMFDYITAYDFLEHIPRVLYLPERRAPFIEVMNEIFRTLKPGGIFFSKTPAYPISAAFSDPTHVNIITADTFPLYFDDTNTWGKIYGFKGAFKVKFQAVMGPHLITVLQKP